MGLGDGPQSLLIRAVHFSCADVLMSGAVLDVRLWVSDEVEIPAWVPG